MNVYVTSSQKCEMGNYGKCLKSFPHLAFINYATFCKIQLTAVNVNRSLKPHF